MAKETAESKLLKLIEETDAKDKASGPAPAVPSAAPEVAKVLSSVSSVGVGGIALPPFLQNLFSFFYRGSQPSQGFGLRQANQLLFLIIIAGGVFFVADFSRGMKEAQRQFAFSVKQVPFDLKESVLPAPKDAAEYVSIVAQRNIFRPFEKKAEEAKIAVPLENQRIKDKVANLKLVGISWLSSPETATVMIEDKNTTITHFLKTGEDLEGVKIDVIYADRVEMSFQGEKMTMNL